MKLINIKLIICLKILILYFIFSFLYIIIFKLNLYKNKKDIINIKVCLCTLGKKRIDIYLSLLNIIKNMVLIRYFYMIIMI